MIVDNNPSAATASLAETFLIRALKSRQKFTCALLRRARRHATQIEPPHDAEHFSDPQRLRVSLRRHHTRQRVAGCPEARRDTRGPHTRVLIPTTGWTFTLRTFTSRSSRSRTAKKLSLKKTFSQHHRETALRTETNFLSVANDKIQGFFQKPRMPGQIDRFRLQVTCLLLVEPLLASCRHPRRVCARDFMAPKTSSSGTAREVSRRR